MSARKRSWIVSLCLVAYGAILVWNCGRVGITVDEPTRLLGGHLLWMNLDDHPPEDQPPLLSLAVGWAPKLLGVPLYRGDEIWRTSWKTDISSHILDRLPPGQIARLFFLARLSVICFPLLTAWLIWHWGRQVFTETCALLLLTLFVLLPLPRGHGALVTSDMAATFTYLLAGYRGWRYWRSPGWRNALWLGLASGLATIAKFSLLIVPPLAVGMVVLTVLRNGAPPRSIRALQAGVVAVLALFVLLAAYRFDTRRFTWDEIDAIRRDREFPQFVLAALPLLHYVPTPREMQAGVRSLGSNNRNGNPVFLRGEVYPLGHWSYFLTCLALKPPIGFQVLVLLGAGALFVGLARARHRGDCLFLLLPGLLYLFLASQASAQLGARLILPTIGYLMMTAGFAVDLLLKKWWGRRLLTAVLAFVVVSTVRVFPQDISYFNEWAGGPENGWRYLSDSNIDWGHNLPELRRYVERNGIRRLHYFQFGFDKVHRYFPDGIVIRQIPPWDPSYVSSRVYTPEPGMYAVHVSLLHGQFFQDEYRDYLSYFRERPPDGMAGYGVYIYNVSATSP